MKLGKRIMATAQSREVFKLRGGPGKDYPCRDPKITECALWQCQRKKRCACKVKLQGEQPC